MKLSDMPKKTTMVAKKIPDGYKEGKYVWAVVDPSPYGDEVVESGFRTRADANAWIAKNSA